MRKSPFPSNWKSTLAGLVVVFALALLLRWPLVDIPLERDEGEYAYIAQRWLLGEIPYQTSFDQKPPGVFVAYAALLRLVGTRPAAVHWGAQIYTLGTLGLIFLLGRQLFSPQAGLLAGLLAALLTADPGVLGNAANTEIFMLLPLTGAFLATLRAVKRRSAAWAFLTGALAAAAVLFKQVAVFDGFFYLVLLGGTRGSRGRLVTAMLLGGSIVFAPCLAYFWLAGAGPDLYDCTIGFNLRYASAIPPSDYAARLWDALVDLLRTTWPIYLLGAVGLASSFSGFLKPLAPGADAPPEDEVSTHRGGRAGALVAAWLLVSFLGVLPGGHFFEHYFLQLAPPLALLAAQGALALFQCLAAPPRFRSGLAVLTVAGALAYGVLAAPWYYLTGTPAEKSRRLYTMNPFPESPAVADFVTRHSRPDESIFVYGSEPQIYFYAGRKCASRYIFVYPLLTAFADTPGRQQAALTDIERRRPVLIIEVGVPTSFARSPAAPPELDRAMTELLKTAYEPVAGVPLSRNVPMPLVTREERRTVASPFLVVVWQRRNQSKN